MEINLQFITPILKSNKKNQSRESVIKYFIKKFLASTILLYQPYKFLGSKKFASSVQSSDTWYLHLFYKEDTYTFLI